MASSSRFPSFRDGDVDIAITGERSYRLHSNTLRHNSRTMRELLRYETAHHQLVLVDNTDPQGFASNGVRIPCVFERVHLDASGRAVAGHLSEDDAALPLFTAFDAVLRALYNMPLEMGNPQTDTLTSLLSRAFDITLVAEYLDCAHIVTQAIESTLLATGQNFYRAISMNPIQWLDFANRIQSKAIFKEALIHAAGQFYMPVVQDQMPQDVLPDDVLTVLEDKVNTIKIAVKKAQSCLSTYYPQRLMRARPDPTDDRDKISRASYSNDIIIWIALSLFRHFLGDQMSQDRTHHADDLGWSFIKTINTGGEAYLSSVEIDRGFHNRFPMSSKASLCLKQRLTEIKQTLKQWTTDLLHENSQLDMANNKVNYFTSTVVTEDDFPWIVPEDFTDDDAEDDGDIYERIEEEADTAYTKDTVGRSSIGLDESVMDEYENFPMDQLENVGKYSMAELDGSPMSEYAEEQEAAEAEARDDEDDQKAARVLMRLNSSRPATPESNHSGDTEQMDPKVYNDYLAEQKMKNDLEADRKRIAEKRKQRKEKAREAAREAARH